MYWGILCISTTVIDYAELMTSSNGRKVIYMNSPLFQVSLIADLVSYHTSFLSEQALYHCPPNTQSILPEQIPRRVVHMIVGKSCHGEVTVVVPILPSKIDFPFSLCRFLEFFG